MPCLDFSPSSAHPRRPRASLGTWAFCTGPRSLLASAGALLALAAGAAAPATGLGAAASAEADLSQRARAWLAAIHQVPPAMISVAPLDARLQVSPCPGGWSFDKPFVQNDGVLRARCAETQWQLFLNVALPRQAAQALAGNPGGGAASLPPAALPPAAYQAATSTNSPQAQAPGQASGLPLVVRRGHTVLTTWNPSPGLEITARLEALDDGRVGDTIRVRNRDTGRIISAQVSGQGQAVGQ